MCVCYYLSLLDKEQVSRLGSDVIQSNKVKKEGRLSGKGQDRDVCFGISIWEKGVLALSNDPTRPVFHTQGAVHLSSEQHESSQ